MEVEEIIAFVIITVLGLFIKSIYTKISKIPSMDDIAAIRIAVSGIKEYTEQLKKEDIETETKQWTKIDDINARLGKVEGIVEMLSRRHNE